MNVITRSYKSTTNLFPLLLAILTSIFLSSCLNKSISQKVLLPSNNQIKAKLIENILQQYQLSYDIDQHSIDEDFVLQKHSLQIPKIVHDQLIYFIKHHLPIDIRMVGFPFKSVNTQRKVIAQRADMAERLSLQYLHGMLEKIKAVYSPGAMLTILCDGIAFSDVFHISDEHIKIYEDTLKILSKDLKGIKILSSYDLGLRSAYFKKIKHNARSVSDQVTLNRMAFELNQRKDDHTVITKTKQIQAYSQHFGMLIKNKFSNQNYIKASVHFQFSTSPKIGLKLSPDSSVTPWHGTLLQESDGRWRIVHLEDINQTKYVRTGIYVNQYWCAFFKAK
ncbi:MAG: hypothetical protein C0432_02265 [Candidatus Puniceispirillum sp.]|nr:hypothetical protein [Candidatus Pelagibacter sp.]MBA4283100.1 hypothetical protein [Candidatus Puniceispirillum sp.]